MAGKSGRTWIIQAPEEPHHHVTMFTVGMEALPSGQQLRCITEGLFLVLKLII